MYTPTYALTPKLLTELTQIERLYGQIEALKIPQALELNVSRQNLVQSSYASNRIEGNPLTLPEVTNLLLDDRVPVNRSEKEVVNYFDLLKKLPHYTDQPVTIEIIVDIHGKLLEGVDKSAGSIRNVKVVIGKYKAEEGNVSLRVKHDPPFHTKPKIEKSLGELITWTNGEKSLPTVLLAGIFHHRFVYIHPFEDGNGRVCRLLTALVFIKAGYQINKYFILDDYYDIDRQQYSDMLHSADPGDETQWLEYFSEGVKHSLHSALFRLRNAAKTLSVEKRATPKEQAVFDFLEKQKEVTSPDVARHLGVTRQQAHNLLSSLVKKGFVYSKGSTKSRYYFVK